MHDELHAARFVEEALEHDRVDGGQHAERRIRGRQVVDDLFRGRCRQANRAAQPGEGLGAPAGGEALCDRLTQVRDRLRQLGRAAGRLAEPERHRRRLAVGILDAYGAALDPHDPVGMIAELEHVAGQALDREVLVDGADHLRLRLEHDRVIGRVGNRSTRGDSRQRGAAPPAQHAVDGIAMQMGAAAPAPGVKAVGQHSNHLGELLVRELAEWGSAPHALEQRLLAPLLRCDLGNDLLRQHVQWLGRQREPVELAAPNGVQQRGALAQLVARKRKQSPLRHSRDGMTRTADPLQQRGDRPGRADLAHQIDLADVDSELERGGRHQRAQLAALQAPFRIEPLLAREAAMVGGHVLIADAF